jgi:predicted MFS family arabinose efflux permease
VVVNEDAVKVPASILGIGTAVIALVAFILNLVGLINARSDDAAFRIALLVTLLGIVASAVSAIWSSNQNLVKWMDTATTIFSLFASYYVLTGIANLADKFPDAATKALALKSRTLLEGTFCATAVFKLIINIFKIQDGSTIYTILSVIALVLELVSYILYLRALSKGKKMLAK